MKVRQVMSQHVFTATPDTTIRELWRSLFKKHMNSIPVVDVKKKLIGIIAKEDLLEALFPNYQEYFEDITSFEDFEQMESKVRELGNTKARDVMRTRVVFTRADSPVMRALSRMIARRLSQMPVLSEKDEVVGLVTKGDIFYALFRKNLGGISKTTSHPSYHGRTL
ncbi:MAG TPA: CBS domain-containing protein [Patescibacteria group bacterium]|nr:CBS domain-containing protein [Patescibacteria group bacterium]